MATSPHGKADWTGQEWPAYEFNAAISHLKQAHEFQEGQFERERLAERTRLDDLKRDSGARADRDPIAEMLWETDYRGFFEEYYPSIPRYSILLQAAMLFEYYVRLVCDAIAEKDGTPVRSRELKGNPVEQAKLFLARFTETLSAEDSRWLPVHHLFDLRDVIVHRNGFPNADEQKELKAAFARDPEISLDRKERLLFSTGSVSRFLGAVETLLTEVCIKAGLQLDPQIFVKIALENPRTNPPEAER
jgi:hypothetical protein